MARVKAPLMSLGASGTIGSSIVFSNWKGRDYVRRHAIPSNPQTAMQTAMRACVRFLAQQWAGLDAGFKENWANDAKAQNISGFNQYIQQNCLSFRQNLGLSKDDVFEGIHAGGTAPTTTITGGVRHLTLSIADGATPPTWGWMIHKGATGFTPSWANAYYLALRSGTPTVVVLAPLAAGTHYFRIKGFGDDGLLGTLEVEKSGTVT